MDTLFDKQDAMLRATSMEIVRNFMPVSYTHLTLPTMAVV